MDYRFTLSGGVPPAQSRIVVAVIAAAVWLSSCGLWPAMGEDSATTVEHKVKAGYLLNFAHFVDWPARAFATTNTPFRIGILGEDRFGRFLDRLVQDETVGGRPIVVLRSHRVSDLIGCQILFISGSDKRVTDRALAALGDAATLTVSETEDFTDRGGMINLFIEGNKVRFEINPGAVRRCGLEPRAQLLRLARIAGPEAGGR